MLLLFVSCVLIFCCLLWYSMKNLLSCSSKNLNNSERIPWISKIWCWNLLKIFMFHEDSFTFCLLLQLLCAGAKMLPDKGAYKVLLSAGRCTVVVYKPDLTKALLNHPSAMSKGISYKVLASLLGDGLVTRDGEKWHVHHKVIAPAFRIDTLKNYISVFNEHASVLVGKLKELIHQPSIEIDSLVESCMLDIIYESTMGLKLDSQKDTELVKKYCEALHTEVNFLMYRMKRPWTYNEMIFSYFPASRNFQKASRITRNLIKKIVEKKKADILREIKNGLPVQERNQRNVRKSFLDHVLNYHLEDPSFTMEEVENEVRTFMGAGHETVAVSTKWVLFMLGLHPEIQQTAMTEIEDVFGTANCRDVTFDDLQKLKYLECIIKETLRIYPSVPIFSRKVTEDIEIGNDTILQGTTLLFFTYLLHRDPNEFPDPEKFIPERFLPEKSEQRHSHSFIPFSAGRRSCIGNKFAIMEMKVILIHVLRNFRIVSLSHRDQVQLFMTVTLKNIQPLKIRLVAR